MLTRTKVAEEAGSSDIVVFAIKNASWTMLRFTKLPCLSLQPALLLLLWSCQQKRENHLTSRHHHPLSILFLATPSHVVGSFQCCSSVS